MCAWGIGGHARLCASFPLKSPFIASRRQQITAMRHNSFKSRVAPSASCDATQGQPAWITPELIRETIRVWQPFYPNQLTPDEASTMLQALGRLFDVLSKG